MDMADQGTERFIMTLDQSMQSHKGIHQFMPQHDFGFSHSKSFNTGKETTGQPSLLLEKE